MCVSSARLSNTTIYYVDKIYVTFYDLYVLSLQFFLIINALLAFTFGASFLLIPQEFIGIYGLSLTPDGYVFARSLGGALIGIGFMAYFGHHVKESFALKGLLLGGLALHSVNAITDLIAVVEGTMDSAGYSIVVLHALLAVGFLYFLFFKSSK